MMKGKKNFKLIALGLMALISMVMFTACSDDGDGEQKPPIPTPVIDPSISTLIKVVEKNEYTPIEFGRAIGNWPLLSFAGEPLAQLLGTALSTVAITRIPQMDALFKELVGTASNGSRQWNIKRRVFTYKSTSAVTGNDTILTGSVIFPCNTVGKPHQVDVLTLYHHQAYFMDSWLPSNSVTLMAMHALHNSAVIEPDGQGAKRDMSDLIRENLQGDLTALQMADCVVAALEIMDKENVRLAANGYSNNWGTSLGTVGATGFAQYMENDATPELQQLIRLSATYIGEGPTMLNQVKGYESAVANPPTQKFYNGWNPRLPFYMSCCKDDELINYDELKNYYTQLQTMPDGTVNTNMHWYDFYMPGIVKRIINSDQAREKLGEHPIHLLSAILSLYDASIVKDPADMAGELDPESL